MGAIGAVFQPELIELMKVVLDDATATLPEAKRTSTMKAEIASHILACAANGERNPRTLKMAALSSVVEWSLPDVLKAGCWAKFASAKLSNVLPGSSPKSN